MKKCGKILCSQTDGQTGHRWQHIAPHFACSIAMARIQTHTLKICNMYCNTLHVYATILMYTYIACLGLLVTANQDSNR
jgi:hypothetical protein